MSHPLRAAFLLVCLCSAVPSARSATEPLWTAPYHPHERGLDLVGDLDGDGLEDLLVVTPDGYRVYRAGEPPTEESVLLAYDGEPPFQYHMWLAGDVDGSGGADAIVCLSNLDNMGIWKDALELTPPATSDQLDPVGLQSSWSSGRHRDLDFQSDGYSDFVMNVLSGARSWFYFGSSRSVLERVPLSDSVWRSPAASLVPDINGDGYPDVLTLREHIYSDPLRIEIRFGGPGADLGIDLTIPLPARTTWSAEFVWLDDFDGDGEPDFAVGAIRLDSSITSTSGAVFLFRGGSALDDVPDFVFTPPLGMGSTYFADQIGNAGDADGDGTSDLVITQGGKRAFVYLGGEGADDLPDLWFESRSPVLAPHKNPIRPVGDWNGDGRDEILMGRAVYTPHIFDSNGDGIDDFQQMDLLEDCDGSRFPDLWEIQAGWVGDCDADQRIDSCQLLEDPSLDCNSNQRLDTCDVGTQYYDCDHNGIVDSCELLTDPTLDCNGDGLFDACQLPDDTYNCNRNGFVDACEDHGPNTWLDCDGNGVFDACSVRSAYHDSNGDGRLDLCETPLALRVAFDPAGLVTELEVSQLTLVDIYVFLDVTGPIDQSAIGQIALEVHTTDQLVPFEPRVLLPGAYDIELPSNTSFVISLPSSLDLGPSTALLTLRAYVLPGTHNARIALGGATMPGAAAGPNAPYWVDRHYLKPHFFGEFRSAFVNRTFEDCNGNEIDDLLDVEYEYASDENGNAIPDECEITATPAASTSARLLATHPNPFNPRTRIRFELDSPTSVQVEIFDLSGRRVRQVFDGNLASGMHSVDWDGKDDTSRPVASGVYFVRLEAGSEHFQHKVALIR